jgi:hypothetical protein
MLLCDLFNVSGKFRIIGRFQSRDISWLTTRCNTIIHGKYIFKKNVASLDSIMVLACTSGISDFIIKKL